MSATFNAAAAAYGNASQLITDAAKGSVAQPTQDSGEFASLLAETVQTVVETGQRSDNLQMQMLDGNASIVDVVTAVAETEIALESMVSVRDRVISAYEEIMRMPI